MTKVFFLLMIFISGCSYAQKKATPAGNLVEVNYHLVICQGESAQWCMQVRNKGTKEWEYFYDTIERFTYQWGYNYTLNVEKKTIRNPAQDVSSIRWILKSVISKKKVPVNSFFDLPLLDVKPTIDSSNRRLQIAGKSFAINKNFPVNKLDSITKVRFRFNAKNEPEVYQGFTN